MTEEPGPFQPRTRRSPTQRSTTDDRNLRAELERILRRTEAVAATAREHFTEGSAAYDVASMAIIRLAGLLERPEFSTSASMLTEDELAAIRTTQSITAHGGYSGFNDDLFWVAVTVRLPTIIHRLLDGERS